MTLAQADAHLKPVQTSRLAVVPPGSSVGSTPDALSSEAMSACVSGRRSPVAA